MIVTEPRHAAVTEDYALECQEVLDLPLADLVAQAIEAGWEPRAVYKAVEELARMQARAYEEDPDPAGE